jgi:hypothetical protein
MLAAVAAALAGCSEAKEKAQDLAATPTKAAFCAAMARIDAPFTEAGQYASREQKVEAAKQVQALLDATAKLAPPDIAAAARTKLEAIRTTAEGESSKLIDSGTLEATQQLKDYCGA